MDPGGLCCSTKRQSGYGWTEADVVCRTTLEVPAPVDDRDVSAALLAEVLAGNSFRGERTVMCRDGQSIRIVAMTQAIFGPDGSVAAVVGASEDITDTRLWEQEAHDLTEHLRLALDASGLGTWRWDIETGAVTWDERLEVLFGFEPGGFDGTFEGYAAALHPEDRDRVLAIVDEARTTREAYRVEHRVFGPDGQVRWIAGSGRVTVDEDGQVTGAIGCSADITEQVLARLEREAAAAAAVDAAERERLHRERLEFIAGISDVLADAHTRDEIMTAFTNAAVPRLGDWCSMYVLPEPGASVPVIETAHVDPEMVAYGRELLERFPYDPTATSGMANVIRTAEPEFYPDITEAVIRDLDTVDEARDLVRELAFRSAIAVPLIKDGRVLGGLLFVVTHSRRRYSQDDLTLAQAVAGRVASSLENRRLADQHRHIATTLQRSLLPDRLPDIDGLDVAVRYWATGEGTDVGGDFYDVFATGADTWSAVIGDVCGTGPTAAALTSLARHTIRQSGWRQDKPATVLSWLNHALLEARQHSFLTAAYVTLQRTDDRFDLTITSGGHPLPVLVKADGTARMVGRFGTLVGVFQTISVQPESEQLQPGDFLVLYTDGLTDVTPPYGLDDAQVTELIRRCVRQEQSADAAATRIHQALVEILSVEERGDDIALLVLRAGDSATPT